MSIRSVPVPWTGGRTPIQQDPDAADQVSIFQAERRELSAGRAAQPQRLPRHGASCQDARAEQPHKLRQHGEHQQHQRVSVHQPRQENINVTSG